MTTSTRSQKYTISRTFRHIATSSSTAVLETHQKASYDEAFRVISASSIGLTSLGLGLLKQLCYSVIVHTLNSDVFPPKLSKRRRGNV